jgi:hypothetical protein
MKIKPGAKHQDRRKIVYWVAGALSVIMFWKLIPRQEKKPKLVKMLTEDGQLVEVDLKHISGQRKKLKADEFHSWVKRKK